MSAALVCGKRAYCFEDAYPVGPLSKKIRCSSAAHYSFNLSRVDHLLSLFPDLDKQIVERVLKECCGDSELAVRRLTELRVRTADTSASGGNADASQPQEVKDDSSALQNTPMNGSQWVELFVKEIGSATSVDDARSRLSRALERLEKFICARTTAAVVDPLSNENIKLKEQLKTVSGENQILKRAVSIQHERQKDNADKSQELSYLKSMVSQYQEQLRCLEVKNYALAMHLKQAQESNPIPDRFHPDVF